MFLYREFMGKMTTPPPPPLPQVGTSLYSNRGTLSLSYIHIHKCPVAAVKGHNRALCAHMLRDPAPDAPVRRPLWDFGNKCTHWDFDGTILWVLGRKESNILLPERLSHKAAFHTKLHLNMIEPEQSRIDSKWFSGQMSSLFTQAGRARSWPDVDSSFHSMSLL